MKQIKDTDYLFLSTYLQAKLARAGEGPTDKAAAFRELSQLAPDPRIVDLFRLKYDYHNAKVYLKSIAAGTENSRLYSPLGRFSPEKLAEQCRSEDYRGLPQIFSKALAAAAQTLGRTADPRLADFLLDRAYLAELQELAEQVGSSFLLGYAALFADAMNLRALARMLKSSVKPDAAAQVLAEGGQISPAAVLRVYPELSALQTLYHSTRLAPAIPELEAAALGKGFAPLEQAVQHCMDGYMDTVKYAGFGEAVLIRYLYQLEGGSV